MPGIRSLRAVALIGVACAIIAPATAGVEARMVVGGDEIAMAKKIGTAGGCEPCVAPPRPGETITLRADGERARRDRNGMSVILRKDTRKLVFVCHPRRSYSMVSYPLRLPTKLSVGLPVPRELKRYNLVGEGQTEIGSVHGRPASTYRATVVNGLRQQLRFALSVTTEAGRGGAAALVLLRALRDIGEPDGGWDQLLAASEGFPLRWEVAERQPETEFVYSEEVVELNEVDLPESTFEVPAGYRKEKFDPICFAAR